ncbi:hypothetical protein [Leisingera caerulea]|uniref:hypothetical protein n=1 Tax=Leisingera caerulea TaxID=506591 RepID=UPI00040FCAA0|nr:hypothetical protein [Leisingera caerulea]
MAGRNIEACAATLFVLRGVAALMDPDARVFRSLSPYALVQAIDSLELYDETGQPNERLRISVPQSVRTIGDDFIDHLSPDLRLCYLRSCAVRSAPDRRMAGPVTARQIIDAVDTLLCGRLPPPIDLDEPMEYDISSDKALRAPRPWQRAAPGRRNFSAPRPAPGELKAQWGKLDGESADLVYAGGAGTARADRALLHCAFSAVQWTGPLSQTWEPSLIEELVRRGYDPETIRFSIKKKASGPARPGS